MRTIAVLLITLATTAAQAKDPPPKPPATQRMSFDDDVVEADLHGPGDGMVGALRHGSHERLIRVRQDFIPEMMRSCESL